MTGRSIFLEEFVSEKDKMDECHLLLVDFSMLPEEQVDLLMALMLPHNQPQEMMVSLSSDDKEKNADGHPRKQVEKSKTLL